MPLHDLVASTVNAGEIRTPACAVTSAVSTLHGPLLRTKHNSLSLSWLSPVMTPSN